jgi:hypothetical protein
MRPQFTCLLFCFFVFVPLIPLSAQPTFSNAASPGTISNSALTETSGLVASRNNNGVLWTHNDVGDPPRIYAISTSGEFLGSYNLSNATHVDYEDIALGPGLVTNLQYLYVGDIGDNKSVRSDIAIYQVPEPAVYLRQATNPPTINLKGLRKIALRYPDGAHNAEAMLVDPLTGDIIIATKQTNLCRIYVARRAQVDAGGTNTLAFVRQFSLTNENATGGAFSPTGGELLIRVFDSALLWTRAPGQSASNALLAAPTPIPLVGRLSEPIGEGISFDAVGRGFYTVSDGVLVQPLRYYERSSPFAFPAPRVLVGPGEVWRYLDTGTNLGTAWRTNGFDDHAWKTGEGQFGYGEGDEQTVVSYGPSSSSKYVTTYFRKTFVATNVTNMNRLELKLLFDDGVAVFLNNTPIALVNLTNNAVFNSRATNTQENLEGAWFSFAVSPALLFEGTNVLAAEVHQVTAGSDDLSFDAQIVAYDTVAPKILSHSRRTNGAFAFTFLSVATNAVVEVSTNLPNWSFVGSSSVTNGVGAFVDGTATNQAIQFYRVQQ